MISPQAIAAIILTVAGFGSGWFLNGTLKEKKIAQIEKTQAVDNAKAVETALAELKTATEAVNAAASGAQLDMTVVTKELAEIRKDVKNAKAKPLPTGCKPDAPRVRSLTETATSVDKAVAGSKSGSAVQRERITSGQF